MSIIRITACAAALLAALCPVAASAQRAPGPVTLVRAGALFDAEAGRMVGPRDLLIQNGRVREVGEGLSAPEGATVVDVSRCSVAPGLIDAHTHLLMEEAHNEGLAAPTARYHAIEGEAYRALTGAQRADQYLRAGFTAVRDLGNSGRFLDLTLGKAIADGRVAGPRIFGSGPGLAPDGGQLEPLPQDPHALVAGEYRIVSGPDDARTAVRQAIAAGAAVIKMYPEATPQRTRLSVAEIEAIVSEARRHGVPVAAHATSDASIREAVTAGVTSIEHAYEVSDETLGLMADKGVWLTPTDTSLEMAMRITRGWPTPPPEAEVRRHLEFQRERLRRAIRAGVRIAGGSDAYAPLDEGRGRAALMVMDAYVDSGMTPAQALRSLTWEAGRVIGDDGLGVLRAGAHADLIAMPADPTAALSALRDLRLVMKAGKVEVADTTSACAG